MNQESPPTVESQPKRGRYYMQDPDVYSTINTKCTHCNTVTVHDWFKIPVADNFDSMQILELLPLYRRVVMCTECGNMSLKK